MKQRFRIDLPVPIYAARMSAGPLQQLHSFLAVARAGSFSGAARELRVSASAVSQAVRQLESELRVTLFVRTTRSVSLTEEGRRLVEGSSPGMAQVQAALREVSARPGEPVGRLRLSVPRAAMPIVIAPIVPMFRSQYPRVQLEISLDERFVDIVAEGFDAGVRLSESIERDMIQIRLTKPFRFVVVGSPDYLARRGTPKKPEDLLDHECITYKFASGAVYAWELERGRKTWRVPVGNTMLVNDSGGAAQLAERGVGLAYVSEPAVDQALSEGRLKRVLDAFAPVVPGYFLYFPRSAQKSPILRAFVDTAKSVTTRK